MPTGIVLSLTKFSDTGSIVHLYTAEQGRVQCAVYGNKYKGILRPLSIVEFAGSRRNNAPNQLTTLSNCQLSLVNSQLSTDIQRQCVAMFIAEVLSSTLRHPMSDQPLFDWLCEVITHLDRDTDISNLHLLFLIEYANQIGTNCPPPAKNASSVCTSSAPITPSTLKIFDNPNHWRY